MTAADILPISHHFRRTVSLAVPVMAARAGLVLTFTVDAIFCGWHGKASLAAFGAAAVPQVTLMVVGIGLLVGTVVLTAQAEGGGKFHECGQILRGALTIAAAAGLFYAVILFPAETWLRFLGQPVGTVAEGSAALRIFGYSMPGILMLTACSFFLEGIHRPLPGMLIALVGNVLNLALNWIFVPGNLGAPEMGAAGAALATSVTRWAMLFAIVGYIWRMPDRRKYASLPWFSLNVATLRRLMAFGLPFALAVGTETGCFNFMIIMAGWLGETELATMYAAINYTSFVYMLTLGLSTAAAVRVAHALGRQNTVDMQRAGWAATGLEFLVMAVLAITTVCFAPFIADIYAKDEDVLLLLTAAFYLTALLFLVDGLQGVLMGALRGAADTLIPTIVYIVSFACVGIPMGLGLGYHAGLGVPALIWSLIAALTLATLGLGWRFHRVSHRPEGGWK